MSAGVSGADAVRQHARMRQRLHGTHSAHCHQLLHRVPRTRRHYGRCPCHAPRRLCRGMALVTHTDRFDSCSGDYIRH